MTNAAELIGLIAVSTRRVAGLGSGSNAGTLFGQMTFYRPMSIIPVIETALWESGSLRATGRTRPIPKKFIAGEGVAVFTLAEARKDRGQGKVAAGSSWARLIPAYMKAVAP